MNLLSSITDLFYPRICIRCGRKLNRPEKYLCAYCLAAMPETSSHLLRDNPVAEAIAGLVAVKEAYAWFYHTRKGSYGRLIYEIKYARNLALARYLGAYYANELRQAGKLKAVAYIVPVPLHPSRKKMRGYNQSEEIAKGVAPVLGAEIRNDLVVRTEATPSQVRKSRYERWENMRHAFRATAPAAGDEDKGILLVDDVITTGSTLLACAHALETAGYRNISIMGLAYSNSR